MKREFSKLTNGHLAEKDFNGAKLSFLVRGKATPSGEVEVHSNLGPIFCVAATYKGLKELEADRNVVTIEYSRPGGTL